MGSASTVTAAGAGEVIALVDCVSFYANAERVFDPSIASRPTMLA